MQHGLMVRKNGIIMNLMALVKIVRISQTLMVIGMICPAAITSMVSLNLIKED
jgi:hypothetical protein